MRQIWNRSFPSSVHPLNDVPSFDLFCSRKKHHKETLLESILLGGKNDEEAFLESIFVSKTLNLPVDEDGISYQQTSQISTFLLESTKRDSKQQQEEIATRQEGRTKVQHIGLSSDVS